jgi:hypothetical protein
MLPSLFDTLLIAKQNLSKDYMVKLIKRFIDRIKCEIVWPEFLSKSCTDRKALFIFHSFEIRKEIFARESLTAVFCTSQSLVTSAEDFDVIVHVGNPSNKFILRNSFFLQVAGPKQYVISNSSFRLLRETI